MIYKNNKKSIINYETYEKTMPLRMLLVVKTTKRRAPQGH